MKNLVLIIISLIIISQCTAQKEYNYFDKRYIIIKAKIFKIEEKKNVLVYHFKSQNKYGVFAKDKECSKNVESWSKIKINKDYLLLLDPFLIDNLRTAGNRISINGDFIWETGMNSTYYDDCLNICSNNIYLLKY